ncbi:Cysteine protease ATG4B, partial [Stegodyphus mimosarum]
MELYNYFTSANGETSVELLKKEFKDFPFTLDFVWILGKKYNALHDIEELRAVISSKIWFSYR